MRVSELFHLLTRWDGESLVEVEVAGQSFPVSRIGRTSETVVTLHTDAVLTVGITAP